MEAPIESGKHLLVFTGTECVKCHANEPALHKALSDLGLEDKMQEFEVWHHADNFELMQKYAAGKCMSIPFYYNLQNDKFICGEADYEKFKEWAQ